MTETKKTAREAAAEEYVILLNQAAAHHESNLYAELRRYRAELDHLADPEKAELVRLSADLRRRTSALSVAAEVLRRRVTS